MAVPPSSAYPAQVDTDPSNYPFGKARNISVTLDGTGTPLEKTWVNDLWGFLQALLIADGATPSGVPDTAYVSQYLDAVRGLAPRWTFKLPIAAYCDNAISGWVLNAAGYWVQVNTSGAVTIRFPVALPIVGHITKIAAYIKGRSVGSSHSALPATPPALSLWSAGPGDFAVQIGAAVSDAPANVAAYETGHYIQMTGLSIPMSTTNLLVQIAGETGANAANNALCLSSIEVTLGP